MTGPVWPSGSGPTRNDWDGLTERAFGEGFFEQPVGEVARKLLGARLVSSIEGKWCGGVIVETEAYGGAEDPASHAATLSGVTERNRAMFGPSGRAYVYRSYGIHWCLNVVTGPVGRGEAVLLRGLTPVVGADVMMARRGRSPLAAGPGRLGQALGVDARHDAHPLDRGPLELWPGWCIPDERVVTTVRIGISAAADRLLRFYVAGASGVSKPSVPSSNVESE